MGLSPEIFVEPLRNDIVRNYCEFVILFTNIICYYVGLHIMCIIRIKARNYVQAIKYMNIVPTYKVLIYVHIPQTLH